MHFLGQFESFHIDIYWQIVIASFFLLFSLQLGVWLGLFGGCLCFHLFGLEREILKAVLWSLISFKRMFSSWVNQSGCCQVISSASSLALFVMNLSSCSRSSGVGWGRMGREDLVYFFFKLFDEVIDT